MLIKNLITSVNISQATGCVPEGAGSSNDYRCCRN